MGQRYKSVAKDVDNLASDIGEVQLTQGKIAIVDKADLNEISKYNWHYFRGYARTTINKKKIKLERFLLGQKEGLTIDHADRNPLNNCRSNLRWATKRQQQINQIKSNRYGYRGVTFNGWNGYAAQIKVNHKKIFIGNYSTIKDAAKAYNEAAKKYHGEFAILNAFVKD